MTMIAIGLCTFRRTQVIETLASLQAQVWPKGTTGKIIVVDNDDTPTAEECVTRFSAAAPVELIYLHRPARNISLARNAVLEEAEESGANFLAFLDDDEIAPIDWLCALFESLTPDADVVLGAVRAIYHHNAPVWMKKASVHDTMPTVEADGVIRTGYTCNCLIRMGSQAVVGRRFDLARGRTGGEDTAYFAEVFNAGGKILFAPDARLTEIVPDHRARFGWLVQRRFRMGQTHGSVIEVGKGRTLRTAHVLIALAKAVACAGMVAVRLPVAVRRNRAILRGVLHLGTASALLGGRSGAIYGATEPGHRAHPRITPFRRAP